MMSIWEHVLLNKDEAANNVPMSRGVEVGGRAGILLLKFCFSDRMKTQGYVLPVLIQLPSIL